MTVNDIAPDNRLRVGLVEAPKAGALFVKRADTSAAPVGVTVDLGKALGAALGMPVEYIVFPNSGECTEATHSGKVDIAFMPVDAERMTKVAFGAPYYEIRSTYAVSGSSGIKTVSEVDRPDIRVIGIANTTTIRASARTLKHVEPRAARSVDEALQIARANEADAFALSRDSLPDYLPELPGWRLVEGDFQVTNLSIAVPPGRPAALDFVNGFLTEAIASGAVARILAKHGVPAA